jgi:HlyD family secretion protein
MKTRSENDKAPLGPAIFVAVIVAAIFGLSLWYLVQPQPVLIQGEAGATRVDVAARVDGRVASRQVSRGDNVAHGQVLVEIDNPELLRKREEAQAALSVARAESARIDAGTRAEVIAQKRASLESALADLTIAQNTFDRVSVLAGNGNATLQRLDEVTNSLQIAQRAAEQAKLSLEEALAGYTQEERAVTRASVVKAEASVATIQAQIDELVVKAPTAGQVYQVGTEIGEFVSPGATLMSLVDLSDVWLRFDMREDFVRAIKVGDRFSMRVPALRDREIIAEVRSIASKGEYSGWRATRATGDFDLRTFEVRAYPTVPVPDLRPGMSVYAQAPAGRP